MGAIGPRLVFITLAIFVCAARLAAIFSLLVLLGCGDTATLQFSPNQPVPVGYENPMLLHVSNHEVVWDGIHDVISDYFRIEHETIPVRLPGQHVDRWTDRHLP